MFLYGLFELVDGTLFEIAFLIVAAGFVYLSVLRHSRTLLFVATMAILCYTPPLGPFWPSNALVSGSAAH